MLKQLLISFFTLTIVSLTYAQIPIGIKGGITQSFVKEDAPLPGTETSLQTGFQAGIFIDKKLQENLILRPALQLTQKGYQSVVGSPGGPFYWSRNLLTTYLELPLDVLYHVDINSTTKCFISTGPAFSFGLQGRLNAAVVATDGNQQMHTQITTDNNVFKNNFDKRFDFGWNIGGGMQSGRLLFHLSYNHGLTNVLKSEHQSLHNRSFSFTVGYLLFDRAKDRHASTK